jgi:hypothetical protein
LARLCSAESSLMANFTLGFIKSLGPRSLKGLPDTLQEVNEAMDDPNAPGRQRTPEVTSSYDSTRNITACKVISELNRSCLEDEQIVCCPTDLFRVAVNMLETKFMEVSAMARRLDAATLSKDDQNYLRSRLDQYQGIDQEVGLHAMRWNKYDESMDGSDDESDWGGLTKGENKGLSGSIHARGNQGAGPERREDRLGSGVSGVGPGKPEGEP